MTDTIRDLLISLASHMAYMQGQLEALHELDDPEDYYWYRESVLLRQKVTDALADEPAAVITEPSDEEIMGLMPQQMHEDLAAAVRAMAAQEGIDSATAKGAIRIMLNRHVVDLARAVLARWGHQPAPPAAGEPSDEDCWQWYTYCPEEGLEMYSDREQAQSAAQSIMGSYEVAAHSDGWHEDMESVSWGMLVPVEQAQVVECKAAEPDDEFDEWVKYELRPALYGHQPAPPAAGEVAELVAWLRANSSGIYRPAARAAELLLLQRQALVPVSVDERLPGPEDCDAEGRCWWFCPTSVLPNGMLPYWCLGPANPPKSWFTHWLPAHALPIPKQQEITND